MCEEIQKEKSDYEELRNKQSDINHKKQNILNNQKI